MNTQPLAARMRPRSVHEFIGQSHLLQPGKPLFETIERRGIHSMILWGPPGTGKTTLAKLLASNANAHIESISAVLAGVKDIRAAVAQAEKSDLPTILFVDEVHRFNKAQQDAFLPFVENGIITLIGATTENPSFELNNALLSRARVYVLKSLLEEDLIAILDQALLDEERGLGRLKLQLSLQMKQVLAKAADGDGRRILNLLEILSDLTDHGETGTMVSDALLQEVIQHSTRRFDKGGDAFYDQISALHKAVRGSSPDGALYWLARMLDGGCDPLYIARRVLRMASEDIGNADPRAMTLALNAWETQQRLGSPEGELAIAQAVVFLACAAKSNAVYTAFNEAMQDAKNQGSLPVPAHICNAPTQLMKNLGHGKDYRYAHDEAHGYAAGENYFPDGMPQKTYYHPVERGLEKQIAEKLRTLHAMDKQAKEKAQ